MVLPAPLAFWVLVSGVGTVMTLADRSHDVSEVMWHRQCRQQAAVNFPLT
jgi:hypothetical protein